jgi:cytochrome c oxidase subunit 1
VVGQVLSYTSSLPVLAVTAVGTLSIVYRSGMRWDLASGLLFLSIAGWAAGILPAVIDGTIVVNRVMHNTLWVPGHFHFYLLLGVVSMIFGFMYYLRKAEDDALDRAGFWAYAIASLGFTATFLLSGKESVPRRYALHLPEWMPYDRIASLFAVIIVAAVLLFVVRFLGRVRAIAA